MLISKLFREILPRSKYLEWRKTVHVVLHKYCPKACCRKGLVAKYRLAFPPHLHTISQLILLYFIKRRRKHYSPPWLLPEIFFKVEVSEVLTFCSYPGMLVTLQSSKKWISLWHSSPSSSFSSSPTLSPGFSGTQQSYHGLINYIDTKAKCRHLKKWTCQGTLRQVFIRVCRLEIQSVMLVFSTQLCELLPL